VRAAVIGAGPSGFYAAELLLAAGIEVDLLDLLPTPFGLVRSGVAPDHPKIKSVVRVYERIAEHPRLRFYGGIQLGVDVSRAELLERYHALVYAVGTCDAAQLEIPGASRPGCVTATDVVGWYNGHPAQVDRAFGLETKRAVVVGNGNVALDIARILVADPDELAGTDIADHALAALRRSEIREVVVLGRRGPAQAAFTTPELRELAGLSRARVSIDGCDMASVAEPSTPAVQRTVEVLRELAERRAVQASHRIRLRFLTSPLEVIGEGSDGPVQALRVGRNRLADYGEGGVRAVGTGEHELLPCGLVVAAIGYRGAPLTDVPFDSRRRVIANEGGRVVGAGGRPLAGEYVTGWIKRGPTGVIGTNKKDSAETVAALLEDAADGRLNEPGRQVDAVAVDVWLRSRGRPPVDWAGWRAIDDHETKRGRERGRPRVKLVRLDELHGVAERVGGR
jgi:ferredoxin/flavodoxin---NADP+ reductase